MSIDTHIDGDPESVRQVARWLRDQLASVVEAASDDVFAARNRIDGAWDGPASEAAVPRLTAVADGASKVAAAARDHAEQIDMFAAALEKAAAARRARAELKDRLKRGGTNLKQVLKDAETDEVLGKMKVSALLEALPKVGKVKAQEIMTELEIAPTRRLRGLGDRQRKALLEKFDFTSD